uniref:Uncharacterized protein n=1 Tax=Arundo donax TaxID=35708 RepID=A0A0A9GMV3_ARUDO
MLTSIAFDSYGGARS